MVWRKSYLTFFIIFLFLKKLAVTSNASRSITKFYSPLSIQFNSNKLYYRNLGSRGKFNNGRTICWTKSKILKTLKQPKLVKFFNYISISYITNLILIPFLNKLVSLIFYVTGGFAFLQLPNNQKIFNFLYLQQKKIFKRIFSNSNIF